MNTSELNIYRLQAQLKTFGLNPSEWTIQKVQALGFLLQNKLDQSFAMYGRIEYQNRRPKWKSLDLISL